MTPKITEISIELDSDGDEVLDVIDNCPFDANTTQLDPDLDKLENVKVSSYEVKKITHRKEQLKVIQSIDLGYYMKDQLKEKTLRYQEVWEYDETERTGERTSGLPEGELD